MNPSPQAAEEVPNWMLEELQTELFEKIYERRGERATFTWK
jgi:hypothetical protein